MKNFQHNSYIDICFISMHQGELCLLLTKRNKEPFKDQWALPGGIWESDLSPDGAASVLMIRKTGLSNIYLEQLRTYGGIDRDPRGPSSTVAYIGLVNYDKLNKKIVNSDGEEMQWVGLDKLNELKLAFDHNQIVEDAKSRIINKIRYTKVGFELVGAEFTLKELCNIFEKIVGHKIDQSNLKKKLFDLLQIIVEVPNSSIKQEGRGRKGIIYKLDEESFKKLPLYETLF